MAGEEQILYRHWTVCFFGSRASANVLQEAEHCSQAIHSMIYFYDLLTYVMGSGMGCLLFSLWLVKYLNEQIKPYISFLQEPCGSCFFIFLLIEIDKNGNVCKWGFLPNLARFKKELTSFQVLSPNALHMDSFSHLRLYRAMGRGRNVEISTSSTYCYPHLRFIQLISCWLSCSGT